MRVGEPITPFFWLKRWFQTAFVRLGKLNDPASG
jgi:hypothetical protein